MEIQVMIDRTLIPRYLPRPAGVYRNPVMGFNPFREEEHSILDVVLVVVAVSVTAALVAWAFLGG